ncbi:hypothetical protein [Cyclobacterium sp. SYSU L10401]|uniref:hypothetical protein n=1 Tax=Cyclobacterium sp. SYSU L10401 TaxID=2678657 RepID=UPI0013D04103|nr:hypothetical protein [Cyclobacterium sp. SYSU L10401]
MMKKQTLVLMVFLTVPFFINAQYYEVREVVFENDEVVDEFFEKNHQKAVQWNGMRKTQMEQQMKSPVYKIERQGEELAVWQVQGEKERGPMVFKQMDDPDVFELKRESSFTRFDLRKDAPIMISGRFVPLEKPEAGATENYGILKDRYGDKVEAFVVSVALSEQDPDAEILNATKAYKVTEVDLVIHEDVVAFGKKHSKHFSAYSESNLSTVEKAYLNKEYKIEMEGRSITISSQNSENSKFSSSSSIEPLTADVYRAEVMKSFWDFHLEDTDEFDVKKLEYSEFLVPKEEDKNTAEYQELKAKYGEKMPYQTIVQYVKEVPVDE